MTRAVASILIVDDDEADRLQLAAALEGSGHHVLFASNGREALERFMEQPVHIVVTDIAMSGGDGLDLIASLKTIKPDAAVIAVSGKGPGGLSVASAIGADTVLTKPVSLEEMRRAVSEALGTG
jgi:CheY-like chemotaxis protein